MSFKIQEVMLFLPRLALVFCTLILTFHPAHCLAAGPSASFATSNLEIRLYPQNSLVPDAVWKIDRIAPDHKRIGFFHVQLLPMLVVQGIGLEFTRTNPPANWLEGFRCEWVPADSSG
jgi:hypothetical protein